MLVRLLGAPPTGGTHLESNAGLYVGAISIWGGLARPNGRASKHDQMFIELNSLDLNVSTSSEVEAGETADHA